MAPGVPLVVSETEQPYAILDKFGATCPHCGQKEETIPAITKKGKKKKVELSLLVHPEWLKGEPGKDADGNEYGGSADDSVEDTIRNENNLYEFLYKVKGGKFMFWCISYKDRTINFDLKDDRVVRFYAATEGVHMFKHDPIKELEAYKKPIAIFQGRTIKLAQKVKKPFYQPITEVLKSGKERCNYPDLDIDHYIKEANTKLNLYKPYGSETNTG